MTHTGKNGRIQSVQTSPIKTPPSEPAPIGPGFLAQLFVVWECVHTCKSRLWLH